MSEVMVLNENNYDVVTASGVVVVDFYADWCGPCKMIGPIVHEVAEESGAYKVCKIDVDESPELAMKYQVMTIPTLIVLKEGKVLRQSVGVKSKEAILAMLKAYRYEVNHQRRRAFRTGKAENRMGPAAYAGFAEHRRNL